MYAHATITAERPNALTLPAGAVVTEGDVLQGYRTICFIVEDGKAWRTSIEIGARDNQRVEVLKKQVSASKPGAAGTWEDFTGREMVLQGPLAGLADGQPFSTAP